MDASRENLKTKSTKQLEDLKKNLDYLDSTDWLFQKNTVNFTRHIPFDRYKNELFVSQATNQGFQVNIKGSHR